RADAAARSDSPALTTPSPPDPASPTTRSSIIRAPNRGSSELQRARGLHKAMQAAGLRRACHSATRVGAADAQTLRRDVVRARPLRLSRIAGALCARSPGAGTSARGTASRRLSPKAFPATDRSAARAELPVAQGEEERGEVHPRRPEEDAQRTLGAGG